MTDEQLDRLIDEVANAMTAAPPDAQFPRRVSTRIAGAGRRGVSWTWVLVPLASACVLMIAVFIARRGADRPKPVAAPAAASVVRPHAPAVAEDHAETERVAARTPEQRLRTGTQPAAALELPPPAVAPIEIDRLDVQPLVKMNEIQISPIAIDRIDITAMP